MRRLLPVLVAAALALSLAACGSISPYAAKVNGTRISEEELDRELAAIEGNKDYLQAIEQQLASRGGKVRGAGNETFDATFVAQLLTRRILLELVHQEVARRKLEVGAAELRSARESLMEQFGDQQVFERFPKAYQDQLVRNTAEVSALQAALARGQGADDAAVKRFYDENPEMWQQTCARHILVGGFQGQPSPAELEQARQAATQIKRRLDAGEDFAAIARAESKDPGSAARGGDLECQPKGRYVPEFEQAMDSLAPGQVSEPVQTQFGFHIIQVVSRKTQTLEEAAPQIREQLSQQSSNAVSEFVEEAVRKARISVNPKYGTFDKEGRGVVPPEAPATTVGGEGGGTPDLPGTGAPER